MCKSFVAIAWTIPEAAILPVGQPGAVNGQRLTVSKRAPGKLAELGRWTKRFENLIGRISLTVLVVVNEHKAAGVPAVSLAAIWRTSGAEGDGSTRGNGRTAKVLHLADH